MAPSSLLQGLNPEQLSAVTHKTGPQLVIAGAGTGKTTVIIRRVAYLIEKKLAKPSEILALTFTDKAAEEMEMRVDQLVPYGFVDVQISTFHAFGDRILREYALALGLRPDYRVLSRAEQLVFLREHLFKLPLKYFKSLSDPTRFLPSLLDVISRAQDEDVSPDQYLTWVRKHPKEEEQAAQREIAQMYKKYQELKAQHGFVDFADQVGLTLKLLREKPAIRREVVGRYKYILVDEFQDTNLAQYELLRVLAGKKAGLTVVGDDDQAIYKFRGAALSNILNFEKHYQRCKKTVLVRNYRSNQLILDAARKLILHNNPDRLEVRAKINKKLIAVAKLPLKKPEHLLFDKVTTEADWVAKSICDKHAEGYKYADFAVLVRANAEVEPYVQALNLRGAPCQLFGAENLYNRPAVKLAVTILRMLGDLADSVALYDLAGSFLYGVSALDLQKINTFAQRRNYTLHYVFAHLEEAENKHSEFAVLADVIPASRVRIKKLMEDIAYYLDFAKDKRTGEVLYHFIKRSGMLAKFAKEEEREVASLARFFEKVRAFGEVAEKDNVASFVSYLNVLKESGDNPETGMLDEELDAVKVLTVHKAKGLEFRVVFMVSLVADKFPVRFRHQPLELPPSLIKEKRTASDSHLKEERRLFYVAMTRAKEELYLCSSADYGGKRERKPSVFVLEALEKLRSDMLCLKKSPQEQIELFHPAEELLPAKRLKKNAPLALSFYQIDDYLTCPLKYKYVHLLHVPLLPNQQILVGAAMHQAVAAYALAKKKRQRFTQKDLLAVLKEHWSSEGFISRQHEEARFLASKEALSSFYQREKHNRRNILAVEEGFSLPRHAVILRGRWDRVEEEKGKIYIIDYKSSEIKDQAEADKRARISLQLALYALVAKEKYGKLPEGEELYFLASGIIGKTKKKDEDLQKAEEKIEEVAEGIRKEKFPAIPSAIKCAYCAYGEICPKMIR